MFIRSLVGAAIGILGGAGAGALTFAWDASMAVGSSWIGATRNWWPLAAYFGALAGALFGLALGLCISLAQLRPGPSAIIGCVVGVIGAVAMLSLSEGAPFWQLRSVFARIAPLILSVMTWTLLGLLLGPVASKLSKIAGR